MSRLITMVQWWTNYPKSQNSGWRRFLEIALRCREEGWRCCLVWTAVPNDATLVEPFRKAGCEIITQPRQRREFDFACVWRTYQVLRRIECDVFHCYQAHTSPLLGAFLARVPVRVWSKQEMSPFYEQGVSPNGLHRLMPSTRVSGWCAHRIHAISERVRLELIEHGVPGDRIETIYGPVEYARFATATAGDIRRELGLDASHILIAMVGHAFAVKGWDIALQAFAKVLPVVPKARLLLAGGVDTCEEEKTCFRQLTTMTESLGVSEYVHFLGLRDDLPEILKESYVFILPSRSEGMPGALMEAMAAGLPCIAAAVGGVPELISHGENGLLFERENVEELAGHLVRLIEDQALRDRIAAQASMRAGAFTFQAYVDRMFQMYKALLSTYFMSAKRGVGL